MNIKRTILSIVIILLELAVVYSQEADKQIVRSSNKVIIDGDKYYIHIVKGGETVYSLCRVYNVTSELLEMHNPQIIDGLKVNTSLKIPIVINTFTENSPVNHIVKQGETIYSIAKLYGINVNSIYGANPDSKDKILPGQVLIIDNKIDKTDQILENDNFIYHTVDIGETAYAISRRYGLKVKDIRKNNEEIDLLQLQVGQIVKIPKKKIEFLKNEENTFDEKYYYLKVERKKTVYSISRRFKINIEDINKANPELKKRELIAGEIIRIPILNDYIFDYLNRSKLIPDDSLENIIVEVEKLLDSATYPCINFDYGELSKPFEIAVFLPMYGIENDSLNLPDDESLEQSKEDKIYIRSKYFIEFYQGLLLALDELRNDNINLNIHLYDTNNDTVKIKELIDNESFKDLDLIIGPVYGNNIDLVAEKAKEYKISLVSPLSIYNKFLKDNLYAFQVNSSYEIKKEYWLDKILSQRLENVIFIHDGNNFELDFNRKFKSRYINLITENIDSNNVFYQEILYYNSEDTVIKETMSKYLHNIVIIPSDNQAFVTDIMSKLNTLSSDFDISVYGMDIWVTYSNIELEYFHNLNTHLFANTFIDYENDKVINFVEKYRNNYHAEPGRFGFQGYDVSYYFIKALQMFGKEFRFCLNDFEPDLLETNLHFKRFVNSDGFVNDYVFTIVYEKDYTRKIID